MRFNERVAIVTGGSRGIGRAIVTALAEEGASVHFMYRDADGAAEEVVRSLRGQPGEATAHKVDVRDVASVTAEVRAIQGRHGCIDYLVNNAGITRDNLVVTMTKSEFCEVIETNLVGVFVVSKAVGLHMLRQRRGAIVNMSSIGARRPQVGQVNYACSKAAIEAFTVSFAKELAGKGVRVNALAPGVVQTEMMRPLLDIKGQEFLRRIPQGRFGTPDEVARVCLFLLSDDARYITGHSIGIDGGLGV